jgi:hypothetical protein
MLNFIFNIAKEFFRFSLTLYFHSSDNISSVNAQIKMWSFALILSLIGFKIYISIYSNSFIAQKIMS